MVYRILIALLFVTLIGGCFGNNTISPDTYAPGVQKIDEIVLRNNDTLRPDDSGIVYKESKGKVTGKLLNGKVVWVSTESIREIKISSNKIITVHDLEASPEVKIIRISLYNFENYLFDTAGGRYIPGSNVLSGTTTDKQKFEVDLDSVQYMRTVEEDHTANSLLTMTMLLLITAIAGILIIFSNFKT